MSSVSTVTPNGMNRQPPNWVGVEQGPAAKGGGQARVANSANLGSDSARNSLTGQKDGGGAGVRARAEGQAQSDSPSAQSGIQEEKTSSVVAKQIEELRNSLGFRLNFQRDDELNRMVVRVMDPKTDEVIRQVPPEERLALAKQLREQAGEEGTGLLIDRFE